MPFFFYYNLKSMEHKEERDIVGIKGIHKWYKTRAIFLFVAFNKFSIGVPGVLQN